MEEKNTETKKEFRHIPVMLHEVLAYLDIKPDGVYLDGTVGGAGHASEICRRLSGKGRFIGLDQDREAVETARERLKPFPMATVVKTNFQNFATVLDDLGVQTCDGILLDLGVSSYQFDEASRGFSYRVDAPLDMRMDRDTPVTAADVVNTYPEQELARILREYGEEPFAGRIASHIVYKRKNEKIETTFQLNRIIREAIPAAKRRTGKNPAKRTYQALRIEINRELTVLQDSLDGMIDRLSPGGRICVITFQSLEDRIVKTVFRKSENPCICPPEFPVCVCGRKSKGSVLTRKAVLPSPEETEENPRAHSAKLRVFRRLEVRDEK